MCSVVLKPSYTDMCQFVVCFCLINLWTNLWKWIKLLCTSLHLAQTSFCVWKLKGKNLYCNHVCYEAFTVLLQYWILSTTLNAGYHMDRWCLWIKHKLDLDEKIWNIYIASKRQNIWYICGRQLKGMSNLSMYILRYSYFVSLIFQILLFLCKLLQTLATVAAGFEVLLTYTEYLR